MYQPIKTISRTRSRNSTGTMPVYGMNLRDDSQLLDTRNAKKAENYLILGVAKMQKRPGSQVDFDTTESDVIKLDEEYLYNYDIEGYGQKVRAYNTVTQTFTNIKTDFTANNSGFTGKRYGDYFLVNTLEDGLWRIGFKFTWAEAFNLSGSNTINISMTPGGTISGGQVITDTTTGSTATVSDSSLLTATTMRITFGTPSGNFTLSGGVTGGTLAGATITSINPFTTGLKITGATSGATAIVLEQTDGGATGSFILGAISGTFQNGEIVTDTSYGRATTSSVVTFNIEAVTNAPKAKYFTTIGKRGMLFNLATDSSGYNYSAADTGANPPFNTWATGTGYNDPGAGSYRNGGAINDCVMIGDNVFLGQQKGWYAFKISQTVLADISSKFDQEVQVNSDFPVYRCVVTNVGMLVASSSGIWRMRSLGQPNIPFSEQWELLTDDLGEDYFPDVNFDNVDITYDSLRGFVYASIGKDSVVNNVVLAIKVEIAGKNTTVKTGATSILTGWNIYKFLQKGNDIYGTSAIDGIRYKLFVGQKDVNSSIHCEYLQELKFGLADVFILEEFFAKAEMSPTSSLVVSFDTYDETGYYEARRRSYTWTPRHSYTSGSSGWGEASYGSAGWGGGALESGLIQDFTGAKPKLRQLSRVYLRIESDDYAEHVLNWFSANVTITKQVRNRQLSEITT